MMVESYYDNEACRDKQRLVIGDDLDKLTVSYDSISLGGDEQRVYLRIEDRVIAHRCCEHGITIEEWEELKSFVDQQISKTTEKGHDSE